MCTERGTSNGRTELADLHLRASSKYKTVDIVGALPTLQDVIVI